VHTVHSQRSASQLSLGVQRDYSPVYFPHCATGCSSAFCTQVADLGVFDILTNFSFNMLPSVKASFPKLVAFAARMAARPKMAAYLESPKYTALFAFPNLEK
jgi:hypothetical protein